MWFYILIHFSLGTQKSNAKWKILTLPCQQNTLERVQSFQYLRNFAQKRNALINSMLIGLTHISPLFPSTLRHKKAIIWPILSFSISIMYLQSHFVVLPSEAPSVKLKIMTAWLLICWFYRTIISNYPREVK